MVAVTDRRWSRGVIFDLDDTMYLEEEYVVSGYEFVGQHIFEQTGETLKYDEWLIECARQKKDGRTFNHLLSNFPALRERFDVADLIKLYREHPPRLQLKDEWMEVLRDLKRRGVFLGVISDGELIGQRLKIKALRLEKLFDYIILTDTYGKEYWKPNSRAFEEMQAVSGLSGHSLVYIGDNVLKDFVSPNELGWHSVRLRCQGQVRQYLEPAESCYAAETTVETLSQLKSYLDYFLT